MGSSAIDLSAGLVPKQQVSQPPQVDLSAGMVPVVQPPKPQPAQDAITSSLMDNPKGEGVYHLKGPAGVIQVPYSKIPEAAKQKYFFANKDDLHRYARDYSADPINESAVDHYLDNAPWWDMPSHVANLLRGAGTGAMQTFTGLDRPPTSSLEQNMQLSAAKPAKTVMEGLGDAGENLGEFFTGEELMGLLGKVGNSAEKLKQAQQLSGVLQKNPLVAKLLRVGVTAAKTGTITGAQTFAKTGGDTDASLQAAALGGGADLGLGLATDFGRAAISAARTGVDSSAARAGADAFSQEARNAVRPHLEAINDAVEQGAAGSQPAAQGGAGADLMPRNDIERPGAAASSSGASAAAPKTASTPLLNVDHILSQVHDFTGAADRLTEVNKAGYETLEKMTGQKFRDLNDQVQAAQKAMWRGQPGAEELFKSKQAEMEKLIDSTQGVNRETLDALKASWRQSYMLRDFGQMWDRSINGVPGATKVSSEQRGIDGKVLMTQLRNAVRRYGRFQIDNSLGPGRLDALEQIAEKTSTKAGRTNFYAGVRHVVKAMHAGAVLGGVTGHFAGNWGAGAAAGASAAGLAEGTHAVLNAIKTNPKVAQNFLFALDSGASAEHYAPFIGTMIQKLMTDSSAEQRQNEEEQPQ